jgi:hypothetical protein
MEKAFSRIYLGPNGTNISKIKSEIFTSCCLHSLKFFFCRISNNLLNNFFH